MGGAIVYFFLICFYFDSIFFVNGKGLDNQFIYLDGLKIQINNIYAERAIESLWSL